MNTLVHKIVLMGHVTVMTVHVHPARVPSMEHTATNPVRTALVISASRQMGTVWQDARMAIMT